MNQNQNQIGTNNSNTGFTSETGSINGSGGGFSLAEINARLNIQENLLLNCLEQIEQLVAGQARMESAIKAINKSETGVSGIEASSSSTSRDA